MKGYEPVEGVDNVAESEQRALLDEEHSGGLPLPMSTPPVKRDTTSFLKLGLTFAAGVAFCGLLQYVVPNLCMGTSTSPRHDSAVHHNAGDRVSHVYPPPKATNNFPSYFPPDVGYPGPTPTGAEPAVIATAPAYPIHTGAPNLLGPTSGVLNGAVNSTFDIFKYWGNLRYGVELCSLSVCRITLIRNLIS